MNNLAFSITNDLLFAEMIVDDVSPTRVQELVQARLNQHPRFRDAPIIHLARGNGFTYPGEPCCSQVGKTTCTDKIEEVTCLKCLAGYGNSISPTGIQNRERDER